MPTNSSGVLRVNGIELAYQAVGEGAPLILLHGGFGSVELFGPNGQLLAAGRQVIGVDLQSHGRSPATDRPMRFETMADDVAALIRDLGFQRASIMGFSLGGGVALRTAIPSGGRRAPRPRVDRVQTAGVVSGDDRRHGRDGPGDRRPPDAEPDVRGL